MKTIYRIYPAIGIARIGNSETAYFIGPEAPSVVADGPYRDDAVPARIKPQAARFRIYEYEREECGNESLIREVVANDTTKIIWQVHLVNRKAAGGTFPPGGSTAPPRNIDYERSGLVIDAALQSISGLNQQIGPLNGEINFIKNGANEGTAKVELGRLLTDDSGRLIVVGGPGRSGSPLSSGLSNYANNDGWFDSVSDGPVKALIEINGKEAIAAEGSAWVVVAPPAYAPGIVNMTTWYDQALNVSAKVFTPSLMKTVPSFSKDIYPILMRTVLLHWVVERANRHHGGAGNFLSPQRLAQLADNSDAAKPARQKIINWLMKPNTPVDPNTLPPSMPPNMPKLNSGLDPDDPTQGEYAALTELQYAMMEQWANGNFGADWTSEPTPVPFADLPLQEQPDALTRAALEGCIGSPFFPGIEVTYVIAQAATYEAPFRIKQSLPPGFLTERMALPWQADFLDCGDLWWPAQRPVEVVTHSGEIKRFARGIKNYGDMVKWWTELGFVVEKDDGFVETERNPIDGQA